jgi:hypothetical protein
MVRGRLAQLSYACPGHYVPSDVLERTASAAKLEYMNQLLVVYLAELEEDLCEELYDYNQLMATILGILMARGEVSYRQLHERLVAHDGLTSDQTTMLNECWFAVERWQGTGRQLTRESPPGA